MRPIVCHYLFALLAISVAASLGCTKPSSDTAKSTAKSDAHGDHEHGDHEHGDHEHGDADHADHKHEDDEDHPKTYDEAIEKLKALQTKIRETLAAGETEKADDAVHDVGHLLEQIPDLAKEAVAEAKHEDVKKDIEELFDHFEKLDEEIHSGAKVAFDEAGEKIDAAIARLHEYAEK